MKKLHARSRQPRRRKPIKHTKRVYNLALPISRRSAFMPSLPALPMLLDTIPSMRIESFAEVFYRAGMGPFPLPNVGVVLQMRGVEVVEFSRGEMVRRCGQLVIDMRPLSARALR